VAQESIKGGRNEQSFSPQIYKGCALLYWIEFVGGWRKGNRCMTRASSSLRVSLRCQNLAWTNEKTCVNNLKLLLFVRLRSMISRLQAGTTLMFVLVDVYHDASATVAHIFTASFIRRSFPKPRSSRAAKNINQTPTSIPPTIPPPLSTL
jgi:hypothetical protein